jgi:hypothetical protein
MASAKATIDHETIRKWVEDRGGCPAHVKDTGSADDPGVLRIDFPGFSGQQSLEPLDWDSFFEAFEANELAFLYQEDESSRFNKLVNRDSVDVDRPSKKTRTARRESNGPHAIHLLERQHREVEGLFEQYFAADSAARKEPLFARIADAVAAHSRIEETIFYPEVLDDETEDLLNESVNEHLLVKRKLAELLDLEIDDAFDEKMEELQAAIDHHVLEEEEQLFKMLTDVTDESFREMGARMKKQYDELIQEEPRYEVPWETDAPAQL